MEAGIHHVSDQNTISPSVDGRPDSDDRLLARLIDLHQKQKAIKRYEYGIIMEIPLILHQRTDLDLAMTSPLPRPHQ